MKKILISAIILITAFLATSSFSQIKDNFSKIDLSEKILNKDTRLSFNKDLEKLERISNDITENKEKNAYLAAGMSLVLPGAGEFYAKSYLKSAIFFAVEAGLWSMNAIYNGKGNRKTDEYQNYANANWDMRKYGQWLKDQSFPKSTGINPNEPNLETLRAEINACEEVNFSHTLPLPGQQQYYEVIGKYQNFIYGWSTAGPDININNYEHYVLPQVQDYMVNRQKANDYFNIASYSLDVVILNHVVSAADAAWTVTIFNKNLNVNTNMNFRNVYSFAENKYILTPFANLKVTF